MIIEAQKTGAGAFRVTGDDESITVDIKGYGEFSFWTFQEAVDHCRHVAFVCGSNPMNDGTMPYFGALNALEALLDFTPHQTREALRCIQRFIVRLMWKVPFDERQSTAA